MAKNCCDAADVGDVHNDPRWRKVLWVALGLNAIMFAVEIVAGIAADSRALQADLHSLIVSCSHFAIMRESSSRMTCRAAILRST